MTEFDNSSPSPRRGLTSVEALALLKKSFPNVPHWLCWRALRKHHFAIRQIAELDGTLDGNIGNYWKWKRVETDYPFLAYWTGEEGRRHRQWIGVIRITGEAGEDFLLFSFLSSEGLVGPLYFVSTSDIKILTRFGEDVYEHFFPKENRIRIDVFGGEDIDLEPADYEKIFISEDLRQDIEIQVKSFFENKDIFKSLGIRYHRGFLFIGPPGTGKTMMIRHLVRLCHQLYKACVSLLQISCEVSEENLAHLLSHAEKNAPGIVILEDMDSLTKESKITRAGLLSQLDGVKTKEGLLIIGTTNNPADIDPAIVHRPSRFDRVWHFDVPTYELRREYLVWSLGKDSQINDEIVEKIAEETDGWSFAYLNELRTSAAILSIQNGNKTVGEEQFQKAFELLSSQFDAGKKNHIQPATNRVSGFVVKL